MMIEFIVSALVTLGVLFLIILTCLTFLYFFDKSEPDESPRCPFCGGFYRVDGVNIIVYKKESMENSVIKMCSCVEHQYCD